MKRAFSLIELIFAIALISLLILFALPSLGSTYRQVQRMDNRSMEIMEAVNLMEATLAKQAYESKRFHIRLNPYGEDMELIEVISNDTEKVVLQSIRPKEGLYAD